MRILIIEDEEKVSRFIVRGLTAESFAVDAALDGRTGLELATTYDYDLIILDLMLPGLNGTEVLRQIRNIDHRVPILMLTARDAVSDKVEHLEAGADDYLTKPFAFAELMARIKALLRRGSVERPNVLRVADLEVDRLSQQVRREGQRIELTAKEYAFLEAKSVFTRLLDGVDPEVVEEIRHAASDVRGVEAVSEVRVRRLGHRLHAELNVAVAPDLTVEGGHEIATEVRHQLLHHLRYLSNATIHIDPATASGEAHHRIVEHAHDGLPRHSH